MIFCVGLTEGSVFLRSVGGGEEERVGAGRGQSEKQNRKDVESPKVCNSSKTLIKMWQPQTNHSKYGVHKRVKKIATSKNPNIVNVTVNRWHNFTVCYAVTIYVSQSKCQTF